MTDTPQKMIVIYDPETLLPKYTVEAPYPESTLTFYEDLVAGDATIALALCDTAHIHEKFILIDGDEVSLADMPELEITTSYSTTDEGPRPGQVYTLFIMNGLPPNSTIIVDGEFYSNEESEQFEVAFDTPGVYEIIINSPPYKLKQLFAEAT